MSNDVDHSIALCALGWEPLDIMRKKAKARMMYKTLNKTGPESLTNLFCYKNEITDYKLRNISSGLCLPHSPSAGGILWLTQGEQTNLVELQSLTSKHYKNA